MKLICHGNRGSRPLGASEHSPWEVFGGDTTSFLIVCGDQLIVIDTGSGFYKMKHTVQDLMKREGPYDVSILFSHYHDDHTVGLPQSFLFFGEGNLVNFYGPDGVQSGQGKNLNHIVELLAGEPHNPKLMDAYKATMNFNSLTVRRRTSFEIGDVKVSTLPVEHGNIKTLGYRIDYEGKSAVIISDMHHKLGQSGKPSIDARIVDFARNSDVLITDSHFTDAEFEANPEICQAFGHSTGEHGVRLCHHASVPIFIAHHHNPAKTDEVLEKDMQALRAYGKQWGVHVIAAKPSLCLNLNQNFPEMRDSLARQDNHIPARYDAISAVL